MSASRLNHWWNGFLLMELRGDFISEAVIEFQRREIHLYHVKVRGQRCTLGVNLRDFEDFYRICRHYHVKIRFIQKDGLPFLARRWMKRKCMLIGIALFFGLVYGMSSVVWQVRATGVDEELQPAVLQAAKEIGLYQGAWKRAIPDVNQIQDEILDKVPALTWVGVQIEGSKVKLEAVQKIPNVIQTSNTPHNLIAAKPATIRYVFATRGEAVVKPGQVVRPGQVVISGEIGAGTKAVPAAGRVLAEVWYSSKVEMPLQVTQSALTGQSVTRDYLVLGPLSLRVWGWQQPEYKSTFESSDESQFHFGGWTSPLQMRKVILYEASSTAVALSQQNAEQEGVRLAAQDVRRQMSDGGEILEQRILQPEVSHGKLYETVMTRTQEDIGVAAFMQPVPQGPVGSPSHG
jgi:similar to stage IV sporulation protein